MAVEPHCPYCGKSHWAIEVEDAIQDYTISLCYEQGKRELWEKLLLENHRIVLIYCVECGNVIGASYLGKTDY